MTPRFIIFTVLAGAVFTQGNLPQADPGHDSGLTNPPATRPGSVPGQNAWNEAQELTDWWNEIKRMHGHVGPWNVLGWRMGKAAMRELGTKWGLHELDIVCHVPLATPYSCLADGLVVGTGNSLGRLDLRLGEVMTVSEIHVSARRKDGRGTVLLLKPKTTYLETIRLRPVHELEGLSRACAQIPEKDLFEIERVPNVNASGESSVGHAKPATAQDAQQPH